MLLQNKNRISKNKNIIYLIDCIWMIISEASEKYQEEVQQILLPA
jgi:hypothetical protein